MEMSTLTVIGVINLAGLVMLTFKLAKVKKRCLKAEYLLTRTLTALNEAAKSQLKDDTRDRRKPTLPDVSNIKRSDEYVGNGFGLTDSENKIGNYLRPGGTKKKGK